MKCCGTCVFYKEKLKIVPIKLFFLIQDMQEVMD